MATFLAIAALLMLLVLALVLRPLWPRHRAVLLALATLLPLATVLLYRSVGTPAALAAGATAAPTTIEDAVAMLERQLQAQPDQLDGWRLLGRSYARMQQPAKARDAFARAAALAPGDADVLVEAAEARALAHPSRLFDAQAVALLDQARKAQPMHQRANWFLGISQRQQGRDADAAATWQALLPTLDAQTAAALRAQIDEARQAAGLAPLPEPPPATGASLRVQIALAPGSDIAKLPAGARVFVIARQPDGPPMPVAAEQHPVSALPLQVTLDDADSPMPTLKLSQLQAVDLQVRISLTGNAMRGPGDIESPTVRVPLPAKDTIALKIAIP